MTSKFKHQCQQSDAEKFLDWIKNRGGVAVWKSINLSNPGASWSTPALSETHCRNCQGRGEFPDHVPCVKCDGVRFEPTEKPTWQASNTPTIFTSADEIGVYVDELYKAFPVGLRRSGFGSKLTDGAQRRVDKYLDECREKHGDSFYKKGVLDIDGASIGIYYTKSEISLSEWEASKKVAA